ncbi:class I SAM-dependent methyltransferase [Mucilaginibacter rubeus]|uniref:Methyltransferase domain-containing protein n=1 Tax=Mucilaginibacter rubeus TaxID=2027860 RepID=A0A5C1I2Y2_9SPHI|nr:methyltransferase domain-containing protein [Mucilaginibacter rubeus]QEM12196.1 methyltransferase domain-containing protein [Mucilaginibacter rubeus]
MENQLEQIRDQQKQSWNKFSPGWKKWDEFNMRFLKPMGDAIIDSLKIKDGDDVLDIAAGTGEPGLTIAALTPNGTVTGTDLAEGMLEIARANAAAKGVKNYKAQIADVSELPFDTESFNAVSCRMGFMFFPDMQLAANEIYRVLKPGGRFATAVWAGPEQNNWVTTIMSVIQKHVILPAPPPGSPGMFRCAKPDVIANLLKQAGFNDITPIELTGQVDYGSFDRYWQMMMEVGAPIVAAMSQADEPTKNKIKEEVAALFQSQNTGGTALLHYGALVISAQK